MNKRKPWDIQKELQKKDIPTINDILYIVKGVDDPRVRALVILEYLTGGRISELVGRKEYYKYSKELIEGKKPIEIVTNKEGSERYKYRFNEVQEGITKRDFQFKYIKDIEVMAIRIHNRKHKTKRRKEIPIPIAKETELVNILINYIDNLEYTEQLFNFGRNQAYKLIMKATGFNNHFFRHIRATHLVMEHKYNEYQLIRFMGWTDGRPAGAYMELRTDDLVY